jgi:hypothetical protein
MTTDETTPAAARAHPHHYGGYHHAAHHAAPPHGNHMYPQAHHHIPQGCCNQQPTHWGTPQRPAPPLADPRNIPSILHHAHLTEADWRQLKHEIINRHATKHTNLRAQRNALCRDFAAGNCTRLTCKYRHERAPPNEGTPGAAPCFNFPHGTSSTQPRCRFSHGDECSAEFAHQPTPNATTSSSTSSTDPRHDHAKRHCTSVRRYTAPTYHTPADIARRAREPCNQYSLGLCQRAPCPFLHQQPTAPNPTAQRQLQENAASRDRLIASATEKHHKDLEAIDQHTKARAHTIITHNNHNINHSDTDTTNNHELHSRRVPKRQTPSTLSPDDIARRASTACYQHSKGRCTRQPCPFRHN